MGAMTDWTARDVVVDFSFLPEGSFRITYFKDGINTDRNGTDYKEIKAAISTNDSLKIHLAAGGGWAARIER